jgi:hypothetical protein
MFDDAENPQPPSTCPRCYSILYQAFAIFIDHETEEEFYIS